MSAGPAIGVRGVDAVARRFDAGARLSMSATERAVAKVSRGVRTRLVRRLTGQRGARGFWGVGRVSGSYLGGRTGQTRARISPGGVIFRRGNEVYSPVGSPDRHMLLHEEGGVIPGWSRIPTANAQTPAGVDINAGRSVRGLPGYRLVRTSAGRLWIVRQSGFARVGQARGGNAARVDFMYLLKRDVRHRGRHIFREVAAEMEPVLVSEARGAVLQVVRATNG